MRHPTTEYLLAYALNALATMGLDHVTPNTTGRITSTRYHDLHDGPLRTFLTAQEGLLAQRYPVSSLYQQLEHQLVNAAEMLRRCEADLPSEATQDGTAFAQAKAALRAAQTRMLEVDPAVKAFCATVEEHLQALQEEAASTHQSIRSTLQDEVENTLGTPINPTDARTIFDACCVADLQTYIDDKALDPSTLPASLEQAAKDPKAFATIQAHCGIVSARASQLERVDQRGSKTSLKAMRSTLTSVTTALETFSTHASDHLASTQSAHNVTRLMESLTSLNTGMEHAASTFDALLASVEHHGDTASTQAERDIDAMFRSDEGVTSEDPNHPLGSSALKS